MNGISIETNPTSKPFCLMEGDAFLEWKEHVWDRLPRSSTKKKKKGKNKSFKQRKQEEMILEWRHYSERLAAKRQEEKEFDEYLSCVFHQTQKPLEAASLLHALVPLVHSRHVDLRMLFSLAETCSDGARAVRMVSDVEWRALVWREFQLAFDNGLPLFSLDSLSGKWRKYAHRALFAPEISTRVFVLYEEDSCSESLESSDGDEDVSASSSDADLYRAFLKMEDNASWDKRHLVAMLMRRDSTSVLLPRGALVDTLEEPLPGDVLTRAQRQQTREWVKEDLDGWGYLYFANDDGMMLPDFILVTVEEDNGS